MYGTPDAAGAEEIQVVPFDVKILPLDPGATSCNALVPFPNKTLLTVKEVAPVPPFAIGKVPEYAVAVVDGVVHVNVPLPVVDNT